MPLYYKFLGSSWGGVPRNITSSFGVFFLGGGCLFICLLFFISEAALQKKLVLWPWFERSEFIGERNHNCPTEDGNGTQNNQKSE